MTYNDDKFPRFWPYQTWINSQLSLARFSGGIRFNGVPYQVEPLTGDLCRPDVLAERRAAYTAEQKDVIKGKFLQKGGLRG